MAAKGQNRKQPTSDRASAQRRKRTSVLHPVDCRRRSHRLDDNKSVLTQSSGMIREKEMTPAEDVALWCALNRMIAEYWADVDEKGAQAAHQFYLLDGLYVIGNNRFEGQDKIQAFYARRRHGTVMTRHLI